MLKNAIKNLKKDGILVYCTCSLEVEENELLVDWALKKYGDNLKLIDAGIDFGDPGIIEVNGKKLSKQISKCKRFWPSRTNTQGFFIAKLKKV